MEESLNRRLAEQWQQFQSHIVAQNTNQMTTPNPPRKRQDTRHTPHETYGLAMQPQPYHTQYFYNPYLQYQLDPPPMYRATDDYHHTSPSYSPRQTEQTENTEWSDPTERLQETSHEEVSAEQI